jgi:hypothetical protein
MKKSIFLFASLILFGLNSIAQETYNLIIFSEEGDGFYAFVNGVRQNDKPETNVKITGLTAEALSLRVEFENKAFPKLKQNMMGEPGFEHTVRIKTNTKKEQKLQYFGKVALADAPKSSASTVAYHSAENPIANSGSQYNTAGEDLGNTTITTTSTSTTTKVNSNPPNDISLNINMGGAGINMNVNGMDGTQGSHTSSSSTTVVTKTSSSSSSSSSTSGGSLNSNTKTSTKTTASAQPAVTNTCKTAMNGVSFDKMKKSVEDKPFSDTKMSTAKLATKNACLSVAQIKDICTLFSMDEDKLTYAKYAYDYCIEKSNYYQVSEIFSFSATTDEFNKFLEAK